MFLKFNFNILYNQSESSKVLLNYFSSPSAIYHKVNQRVFKSKFNDFLKLSSKISQLYIMLIVW